MKINIRGQNITVTPALKEYAEKKIGKLAKYFEEELTEANVRLLLQGNMHTAEVTIPLTGGFILRGEDTTGDMYASIDKVVDKIERQIRKYKTRINRKVRNVSVLDFVTEVNKEVKEVDAGPKIVRTKRFAIKPMDAKEASLQMDLLGHDFFVFLNAETEEVSVVYKRRDGNYGLIEPILG